MTSSYLQLQFLIVLLQLFPNITKYGCAKFPEFSQEVVIHVSHNGHDQTKYPRADRVNGGGD